MTEIVTSTAVAFTDSYDDFDAAWESVAETVKQFADTHRDCRIRVDETRGYMLAIFVSSNQLEEASA